MAEIECLLLTGGQSRRMGSDKAALEIVGVPMAARIAALLAGAGFSVTILGREPIPGFSFQADVGAFEGPLSALARFEPKSELIFVAACDMPFFRAEIVAALGAFLEANSSIDAAMPMREGRRQPLCALYRRGAWTALRQTHREGHRSLMAWLDRIKVAEVAESALADLGIDPRCLLSTNTPDQWRQIVERGLPARE